MGLCAPLNVGAWLLVRRVQQGARAPLERAPVRRGSWRPMNMTDDNAFKFDWMTHNEDASALRYLEICRTEGKAAHITEGPERSGRTLVIPVESLPAEIRRRRLSMAANDLLRCL